MEFKNAFSIMITKFNLVYRIILYVFIVVLLVSAIGLCFLLPTLNNIKNDSFLTEQLTEAKQEIVDFTEGEQNLSVTLKALSEDGPAAIDYIKHNTATMASLIVMFIVMFILYRFAVSLCYVSITDILKEFMTSNLRYSFLANFIKNFRMAINFSAGYGLVFIPIDLVLTALLALLLYGLLPIFGLFAFTVTIAAGVTLFALRLCYMSGILPYMVCEGEGNFFKAMKKSWPITKSNFRGFLRSITLSLFMYFTLIATCALPTAGIMAILAAAMFSIYSRSLEMCYYFRYKKAKYYIDFNTVVDPSPFSEREDLVVDTIPPNKTI